MSEQQEPQDFIWLVKSNNSVLGPYKFDEVVDSIFKGDIHVLDEIKGPFERWRPIRDHSLFNAAIERLKATTYARREYTVTDTIDVHTEELTQTQTATGFDDTQTITSTGEITVSSLDSRTPVDRRRKQDQPIKTKVPLPNEPVQEPPKVYPQPQKPKTRSSSFPIAFFLTLVVIVGGAVLFAMMGIEKGERKTKDYSAKVYKLLDEANAKLEVGENRDALRRLLQAYQLDRENADVKLKLAPLIIQLEDAALESGLDGSTLAAEVLQQPTLPEETKVTVRQIFSLGHAYRQQDLLQQKFRSTDEVRVRALEQRIAAAEQAIEDELKASLKFDKDNYTSLINLGFSLMSSGKPAEAITYLQRAIGHPSLAWEGVGRYLLTRAHIEQGDQLQAASSYQEAVTQANHYIRSGRSDFRQEILFLRAMAELKLAKTADAKNSIFGFLSIDPQLTSLHIHDPLWNRLAFDWHGLQNMCLEMIAKVGGADGELIRGFCEFKRGNTATAAETFDKLKNQSPSNGIIHGLSAAVDISRKSLEGRSAIALLQNSITDIQLLSSVIIRDCLISDDLDCAGKIYNGRGEQVLDIYQFWYKARSHADKRDREFRDAMKEVNKLSNKRFKFSREMEQVI